MGAECVGRHRSPLLASQTRRGARTPAIVISAPRCPHKRQHGADCSPGPNLLRLTAERVPAPEQTISDRTQASSVTFSLACQGREHTRANLDGGQFLGIARLQASTLIYGTEGHHVGSAVIPLTYFAEIILFAVCPNASTASRLWWPRGGAVAALSSSRPTLSDQTRPLLRLKPNPRSVETRS